MHSIAEPRLPNEQLRSDLLQSSLSESTLANYRWLLRQFAAWCRDHDIDKPDNRIVIEFLTQLFVQGYAPGTIGLLTDALNYDARLRNQNCPLAMRSVMRGIMRNGRERCRGQSEGLTFEQYDRILTMRAKFDTTKKRWKLQTNAVALIV